MLLVRQRYPEDQVAGLIYAVDNDQFSQVEFSFYSLSFAYLKRAKIIAIQKQAAEEATVKLPPIVKS